MVESLSKKVCRAVFATAVLVTISGIASFVIGLIIMGTYGSLALRTSVGIWCGALMILHAIFGVLMGVSKHYAVGLLYLLVNIACLPLAVYGVLLAKEYHGSFSDFRKHNDAGLCAEKLKVCTCGTYGFLRDYATPKCSLLGYGENLWLAVFILCIINTVFALIGLWCAIISMVILVRPKMAEEDAGDDAVDGPPVPESTMRVM